MAINLAEIKNDKVLGLVLRMQRLAKTQYVNKYKVISLTALVDDSGDIIWGEPECTPLEPGAHVIREFINRLLNQANNNA